MKRYKENEEAGFSMIELMVVIAILGIITGIAIPAFLNQRKSALSAASKQDASNAAIYIAQNQSRLKGHLDYSEATGIPGFITSPKVKVRVYGSAKMGRNTSCIETWHTDDASANFEKTRWHIVIDDRKLEKGSCF